jgi:hypothetical protein
MSERRTVLLAGERSYPVLHDLLSSGTVSVRVLTRDKALAGVLRRLGVQVYEGGLDDCGSIRTAAKGCYGVFGAPDSLEQGRNLIKVVAGSEVDQFLVEATSRRDELAQYAESVGAELMFVGAESADAAASILVTEHEEQSWRLSSLPFFL